ncbi:MAG: immune inhibitor A domain-containing protein, partial [Lachnospiraceae bacterium]
MMLLLTLLCAKPAFADGDRPAGRERTKHFELLTPDKLQRTDSSSGETLAGASDTETYLPLVIIAIGFEEQPYSEEYDWSQQIFEGEWSVGQFYKDMSCGKFTFVPAKETSAFGVDGNTNTPDAVDDGVIHVSLPRQKTMGWAIDEYNIPSIIEELEGYRDAILAAGAYIDFASYDTNADGRIQTNELALGFVVTGLDYARMYGEADSYSSNQFLWPNAFSLSEYQYYLPDAGLPDPPAPGGVVVDNYITIAEAYIEDGVQYPSTIGVLTHELGHYLGLPDLYSTNANRGAWSQYRVDELSLMDHGAYGEDLEGNPRPYSLDIWSRVTLGWVEPQVIPYDSN